VRKPRDSSRRLDEIRAESSRFTSIARDRSVKRDFAGRFDQEEFSDATMKAFKRKMSLAIVSG
jgi:hypothetical protein